MNILNTIDITSVIFFALLAWAVIATVVLLDKMEALELEKAKRRELEEAQTADQEVAVTPTEIPENDKEWHIRSYVVEGIRAGIVNRLGNTITKHRDPERSALEITEELLTKNAQL